MANDDEITKILAMLNAAYPRFKLTEETITVYIHLLGDLAAEDLKMAAVHCATNSTFFPSVNELRRAVVDLKRKASKTPSPYEAWIEVASHKQSHWSEAVENEDGSISIVRKTHEFSHPLVEKVAREMGWPGRFPGTNSEMADRSHFIKAYEAAINDITDYELMLPEVREYISSQTYNQLEGGEHE